MPFRALAYIVRVWDAWLRDHRGSTRLPPVIPVLLAQVDGGWTSASDLLSIIDFADDAERALLGALIPQCRIVVDDLAHLTDDALDARALSSSARLALAALRDVRGSTNIDATLRGWGEWLRAEANIGTVLSYTMHANPLATVEVLTKVIRSIDPKHEDQVMTTAAELIQQGEAKGIAKGVARGKAELLLQLMRLRFPTAVSAQVVERVEGADAATLGRWADRVLSASSLDEILAG